ncbi:histidine kinase [Saccharopolyspora hirsuta]|uniref:Sensor histidine kinase n=1 Tax=Saccharopolyspora hirsuta TaxID=1837 RepID=A0A5M7BCT8_SACHI|nr:histidine kinase [Saccharopolyspora hirsuta]KAA5824935.1 sensor histidine kinase [Saccharopolyspora hirsuta]
MPVPTDRPPRHEPRGARWPRRAGPEAVLRTARRLAENLRGGPAGPQVPSALRDLRRLLAVDAVGLSDLSGSVQWSGRPSAEPDAASAVADVLHTETRSGRPPLVAVPLRVQDELTGVLVVDGETRMSAVREVVAWTETALDHARLEHSAELAAQAELRALRAEISPHFMYNAMSVIASLVRSDPERSHELMLDFADFIRYGLARHRDYTTVSDEFHAIETYLALQRAVLGERLRVQIRVAPEVLAVAIPYLVLQPLVENAVRHGIEPRFAPGSETTGTVQVRGEAEGTDLVISVEDDGVGMDPAEAEAILAGRGPANSVGLANVDRRLRSVYGAWYGLVVETAAGAGTRVVVRVPRFQPGVVP